MNLFYHLLLDDHLKLLLTVLHSENIDTLGFSRNSLNRYSVPVFQAKYPSFRGFEILDSKHASLLLSHLLYMGPVTVSPCSRAKVRNSTTNFLISSYLASTFTRLRLEHLCSLTHFTFVLSYPIDGAFATPKCSATSQRLLPSCSSMSNTSLRCSHVSRAYLLSDSGAMKEKL